MIVLNPNAVSGDYNIQFTDLGLPAGTTAQVRDLWAHKDLGPASGSFAASGIASHESRVLKLVVGAE